MRGYENELTGMWHCPLQSVCARPRMLAKGVLISPAFDRDGAEVVAITTGLDDLSYVKVR